MPVLARDPKSRLASVCTCYGTMLDVCMAVSVGGAKTSLQRKDGLLLIANKAGQINPCTARCMLLLLDYQSFGNGSVLSLNIAAHLCLLVHLLSLKSLLLKMSLHVAARADSSTHPTYERSTPRRAPSESKASQLAGAAPQGPR